MAYLIIVGTFCSYLTAVFLFLQLFFDIHFLMQNSINKYSIVLNFIDELNIRCEKVFRLL